MSPRLELTRALVDTTILLLQAPHSQISPLMLDWIGEWSLPPTSAQIKTTLYKSAYTSQCSSFVITSLILLHDLACQLESINPENPTHDPVS